MSAVSDKKVARSSAVAPRAHGATTPVVSVVVPVYNEESGVRELIARIVAACQRLGVTYEIIAVNDGSADGTLGHLVDLSREFPALRVIDLIRNFGHMPALSAGLASARGAAVIAMDGDLQDPPELIPSLYEEWTRGNEVVYARRQGGEDSFVKRLGSKLFYDVIARLTRRRIPSNVGTYGLMDRRIVHVLNALPERSRFIAGLRSWVSGRYTYVDYHRSARRHGSSRVGFLGLVALASSALVSFSRAPLRLASLISLSCAAVMFVIGSAAVVIRLTTHDAIPGWATYTTLIGFMGFVQSLVLAAMAEYLGVIFEEVKARPLYLVRSEYVRGEPLTSD
jgi:glycosyltransferase involved in cell wall biosynthesis